MVGELHFRAQPWPLFWEYGRITFLQELMLSIVARVKNSRTAVVSGFMGVGGRSWPCLGNSFNALEGDRFTKSKCWFVKETRVCFTNLYCTVYPLWQGDAWSWWDEWSLQLQYSFAKSLVCEENAFFSPTNPPCSFHELLRHQNSLQSRNTT